MEMKRSGGSIIGLVIVALIIESLQYYEKIEGDVAKVCLTLLEVHTLHSNLRKAISAF
jgi:hypothetical protein